MLGIKNAECLLTFSGVPANTEVITIISYTGLPRGFMATNGANDFSLLRFSMSSGDPDTTAENLKLAIEHSSGFGGQILCERVGPRLFLTQARKGTAGNRAIDNNLSNVAVSPSFGFANGEDLAPPFFLNSIGPPTVRGRNQAYRVET